VPDQGPACIVATDTSAAAVQARGPSVLFAPSAAGSDVDGAQAPAYFADLNIDQIVASVAEGRDDYDLPPFFSVSLPTVDAVTYRHEVFRDLEHEALSACVAAFAAGMREMRGCLAQAQELRNGCQKQRWFIDAAATYCDTVARLAAELQEQILTSRGLLDMRGYLANYVASSEFCSLRAATTEVVKRLANVQYAVRIRANRVTVLPYADETDYTREVEQTFQRFRQGTVASYLVRLPSPQDMNHVEASVQHGVTQLHPDVFDELARYCERYASYLDATIGTFDREVQFYLAYREHVARLELAGLRFCYPTVSADSKQLRVRDAFDVALAAKLVADRVPVVCNDFHLDDPERILVVSGPNQGGKTTFARMFGQLHHLASLGCPVPGSEARLFLLDALFTHFEKEEDIGDLSGKLATDLRRIHGIVERATPRSVVIMNESFASTTLDDAVFLGTKVLEQLIDLDLVCVCVTFVDELASLGATTVSMVSTIVPGNPALRTYKIERRPADGLAHAAVLAEKHGLTYEALTQRIAS
jgi:DNA mismatch repair protein MutS